MEVDIFINILRAVIVELLSQPWSSVESLKLHISLEQSYIFRKLLPQIGLLYFIGEAKCLSPSSNYPFAYLKSLNRKALKAKQAIIYPVKSQPSFTGLNKILACVFQMSTI